MSFLIQFISSDEPIHEPDHVDGCDPRNHGGHFNHPCFTSVVFPCQKNGSFDVSIRIFFSKWLFLGQDYFKPRTTNHFLNTIKDFLQTMYNCISFQTCWSWQRRGRRRLASLLFLFVKNNHRNNPRPTPIWPWKLCNLIAETNGNLIRKSLVRISPKSKKVLVCLCALTFPY